MPLCQGQTGVVVPKMDLNGDSKLVVIKVGTSSLVLPEQQTLNLSSLARICETIKILRTQGHHVIIVSSGAVGVGCQRLGLSTRPTQLAKKQALAAVGQVHLMRYYEDFLSALGLRCAQVLITLDNFADRDQYFNVHNTFAELLSYGTIPVVNENDTVAVQGLRFGDNDTLSAQVAALVQADWLFLMTDVDCLYTSNPKDNPDALPIYDVEDMASLRADTSTQGTQWGTGGMATKLTAARIAMAAGCTMVICNSIEPQAVVRVLAGDRVGTRFHPSAKVLTGRKRWILSVPVRGVICLDKGAVQAVQERNKSVIATGITSVEGDFQPQDAVSLCDTQGVEFARGLINMCSEELKKATGGSVEGLLSELGCSVHQKVVHRDNISLLFMAQSPSCAKEQPRVKPQQQLRLQQQRGANSADDEDEEKEEEGGDNQEPSDTSCTQALRNKRVVMGDSADVTGGEDPVSAKQLPSYKAVKVQQQHKPSQGPWPQSPQWTHARSAADSAASNGQQQQLSSGLRRQRRQIRQASGQVAKRVKPAKVTRALALLEVGGSEGEAAEVFTDGGQQQQRAEGGGRVGGKRRLVEGKKQWVEGRQELVTTGSVRVGGEGSNKARRKSSKKEAAFGAAN